MTTPSTPKKKSSNVTPIKRPYGKTGHVTVMPTTLIEGRVPKKKAAGAPKKTTAAAAAPSGAHNNGMLWAAVLLGGVLYFMHK